jgi:hypothetical protein
MKMNAQSKIQEGVTMKDMKNTLLNIFDILYVENNDAGERVYNPDKEWDAETIELVAEMVNSVVEGIPTKEKD